MKIITELHHAFRRLAANPGFAIAVAFTLALGIGAACLYGGVVEAVLLRPLPYHDSPRLAYVWETDAHNRTSRESVSWPDLRDWRDQAASFDALGGYARQSLSLAEAGSEPERIVAFAATADLLPMLGLQAMYGRLFDASDDLPNAAPVVVLDQELWRRRYASDPDVVGRIVQLDGVAYEVIGVLADPPGAPLKPGAWTPLRRALGHFAEERGVHTLRVIGHLRAGVSASQAQQEMDAIAARLDRQYPDDNVGRGARVESMQAYAVRDLREPLLLLGGVFALLLGIALINVASLLAARASTRLQELATRVAIGATRARIAMQLATEGLLMGTLGGGIGLLLTQAALALFRAYGPADVVDVSILRLDGRLVAAAIALSALSCAIAATLPALSLLRGDPLERLRGGRLHQRSGQRTRRVLVGVQVALAMALALGSGLLLRSFWQMAHVPTGLVGEHVLATSFSLPQAQFPMPPPTEYPRWPTVTQFYDRLLQQVRGIDGVRSAAIGHARPLRSNWSTRMHRADSTDPQAANDEWEMRPVSPGYFSTLGVPLLRGRDLDATDRADSAPVLLINDATARRYFPGEDPIGKRIVLWKVPREIVGVVGDVRSLSPNEDAAPSAFPPLAQTPFADVTLVVKTDADPLALLPAVRAAIRRAQPDLALFNVSTLDQDVQAALGGARFGTGTVTAFALLALALSAVGVFGIVALEVGQRSAEIGLRRALGAQARDVLRLALARTLRVVAIGAFAGCLLIMSAGRLLQGVLGGISAADPLALAASVAVLFAVAVLASSLPARRALRVDPVVALRHE